MLLMKKWMILILVAWMAIGCGDANQNYVRRAVRLMDKHGLFAEGPAWEAAKAEALAAKPDSLATAHEITRKALKVAGGKHSFIYKAESVQEDQTREWEYPSVQEEEDGIVIIQVPTFSGSQEEALNYAKSTLDKIPDAVRGAVIDLRGNTGGNMYPMIASVHRFIQDDVILRFRGSYSFAIDLRFVCRSCALEQGPRIDCPVAVLTDGRTASSGEAVLICFRGMPRARSFGAPSAGYASANNTYPMPDGSQLVLTTSCDVARTGEEFCDDPIAPDVLTETPLEDALAWLREQIAIAE